MEILSDDEVRGLFGGFDYVVKDNGQIEIAREWIVENIRPVYIPQLQGIKTYGGHISSGNIHCNYKIHEPLKDAFDEIEGLGFAEDVIFWGGSFNPRLIRGSTDRISRHAWGIAFDLNPQYNQYGKEPAAVGENGTVLNLIDVFKKYGFTWGGLFTRKDGMHFEYCNQGNNDSTIKAAVDEIEKQLNIIRKAA